MRALTKVSGPRDVQSIAVLVGALCIMAACAQTQRTPAADDRTRVEQRAAEVLGALKGRDGERLAALVQPVKGVRFSPYQYVHVDSDVVLQLAQVRRAWLDNQTRLWGYSDGSGAPLRFPFETYYRRFVWDHDYASAARVAYDAAPLHRGNTPNNIPQAYPGSVHVEYHFPGFDAKYEGMDWTSLFLVFEKDRDEWWLVGVVHASWTI